MTTVSAYAAKSAKAQLEPFEFELGDLPAGQVDIDVTACGLCHSDMSMINNDWGYSKFPLVAGHEIIGTIRAVGDGVTHLKVGQTVGVGWSSHSCMTCGECMSGDHHHCPQHQGTIVHRHGGFADKVRVDGAWAIPLPDGLDAKTSGPLFCGGATVFTPFLDYDIRPTDKVGVIGIGGLGHLAVQFARAWGCEVTAFTTSDDKTDELKSLGAHKVVNTRDGDALEKLAGTFDYVISTVNVSLPWGQYIAALAPKGHLITVGAVGEPMEIAAFSLIAGQKRLGGSQVGSPHVMAKMLEFCARHDIKPMVEHFAMKDINDALERLESGKTRYRIVLTP